MCLAGQGCTSDRIKRRACERVKGCERRREGCCGVRRGREGRAKGCARTDARVEASWCVRGCVQRARDVHDDHSDIVVIVEGTIARQ